MGHFCRAAADVQRRAGEFLDAERVEADAGADDVHDGVHGADFVEMNFLERNVMDRGFGFAEFVEDGS